MAPAAGGEGKAPGSAPAGAVCIVLAAGFSQLERDIERLASGEPGGLAPAAAPAPFAPAGAAVEGAAEASFPSASSAAPAGAPSEAAPAPALPPLGALAGVPKALLPVAGKPMLDHWWGYLSRNRTISEIFIVTNAIQYKHFERWATARGLPVSRVVNSGATAPGRGRGVLRDVELGLRRAAQAMGSLDGHDVLVFAGDTLFFKDFDLDRILDFRAVKGGSLLLYYSKKEGEKPSERGMCQVDSATSSVVAFAEKPAAGQRGYTFPFVSPLFYILAPEAWQGIPAFNAAQLAASSGSQAAGHPTAEAFSFGRFVEHAVETMRLPFWGMRMPGAFSLIGAQTGIEEYRALDALFSKPSLRDPGGAPKHIVTRTYARVGLMGNPSDGFHGKTIACTIANFFASVELWESEQLRLLPHPLYDPSSFSGLADLHFIGRREGYYGGTRLLMATCKRFQELCTSSGIALPRKNFTAKYDTNVPRQVGLAGSSAIVTSLFQALMQFYNLTTDHIPLEKQPSFVLSVEQELGIQAGLQDRVVQVYRGLVFMDFDAAYMKEHGHGRYERLPRRCFEWLASLPLFIAYESDPSDSGKIHSNVRARWDAKEPEVLEAMAHFAQLAARARQAIEARDHALLADLMDENFATRRRIYGDACLGPKNLRMVEICQRCGAAAKFPGSGGAVLGLCRPPGAKRPAGGEQAAPAAAGETAAGVPPDSLTRVREALEAENFVFCPLDPIMPDDAD